MRNTHAREVAGLGEVGRTELALLALLVVIASVAAFSNLGAQLLWQDEAQSALLGRSTLEHGIPLGTDGLNFFSQEDGVEVDDAWRWRWHTWLHFYLVAAAFALFGESTIAARLPSSVAAVATVVAVWALARALWARSVPALSASAALVISVPFWILARQCRWYSLTELFSVLALLAAVWVGRRVRGGATLLVIALLGLFHSHYVYVPGVVVGTAVAVAMIDRSRLRSLGTALLVAAGLCAPWILWQSGMDYGAAYGDLLLDPSSWARKGAIYVGKIFRFVLPPAAMVCGLVVVVGFVVRGRTPELRSALRDPGLVSIAVCAAAIGVTLTLVSPDAFFRYLSPLVPLAALAIGALFGAACSLHRLVGVVFALVLLASQPLAGFAGELTGGFDGPIEGIVTVLRDRAEPDDVVLITYGDLPLKFYTPLRVIGGLTGEDLSEAAEADWVILRRHTIHPERDGRVARFVASEVDLGEYRKIELPQTDTPFENREEPADHRFRPARGGAPVVLYERRR